MRARSHALVLVSHLPIVLCRLCLLCLCTNLRTRVSRRTNLELLLSRRSLLCLSMNLLTRASLLTAVDLRTSQSPRMLCRRHSCFILRSPPIKPRLPTARPLCLNLMRLLTAVPGCSVIMSPRTTTSLLIMKAPTMNPLITKVLIMNHLFMKAPIMNPLIMKVPTGLLTGNTALTSLRLFGSRSRAL